MLEPITVSTSMMIADGRRGALLALVTVLLQLQPTFQWSSAMSTLSDRLLFQYRTDPLAQVRHLLNIPLWSVRCCVP